MNSVEKRIELARAWADKSVPFHHLGRDENGTDCIGLLVYAIGYPENRIPAYSRDPHGGKLEAELDKALGAPVCVAGREGVHSTDLQPGDLVALAYGLRARHVGIVAQHPAYPGHLSLIHTDLTVGRVTEHILDELWLGRIRRVWR